MIDPRFDPEFDPYDELLIARHNIKELILAINHYSELLKQLAHQHEMVTVFNKQLERRVSNLESQLRSLKQAQI